MWSIWVKFMKKVKNLATLSLKIILYPAKLMMNIRGTSKGTTLPTIKSANLSGDDVRAWLYWLAAAYVSLVRYKNKSTDLISTRTFIETCFKDISSFTSNEALSVALKDL